MLNWEEIVSVKNEIVQWILYFGIKSNFVFIFLLKNNIFILVMLFNKRKKIKSNVSLLYYWKRQIKKIKLKHNGLISLNFKLRFVFN